MKSIIFALTLFAACLSLYAQTNYMWLTDHETSLTFPGDIIRFWGRDTLWGPVHSNDWIATGNVAGLPVAYDVVSTSRPSFRPGSPNPAFRFLGGDPVFNAPIVLLPSSLEDLQSLASQNGAYFSEPHQRWYASIQGDMIYCYHCQEGTFLDTLSAPLTIVNLNWSPYVYFDGTVDVRGELFADDQTLVLGSSHNIRIVDNVMLQGTNMYHGTLPAGATSRICLASEEWIIIGNTTANGRGNCGGHYTDHTQCHVVITALLFALGGSLQLEQMNDSFDPYVSPITPDERGNLILTGGITQRYRGFVHRSNLGGTGYNNVLHYDARLRNWHLPFMSYDTSTSPDSLVFEDTPVGTTITDTLTISMGGSFSGAYASYPFYTNAGYQFSGPYNIPVSFTPPSVGPFYGNLTFYLGGQYNNVILYGNGTQSAPPLTTEVFPNPFNNISTLRLTLPEAGHVRATVYNIIGQEVARLADQQFAAGQHILAVDGAGWASGLYFLRVETLERVQTKKLMLIK
ncbi:MAG: T9SS type A sorting domain-containing protein [Calditrichaeota bacterium]|nr:T9SS type A sorting domain-containing protein [Calditrichota bacterium]MCB9369207.1 T9SS type A sorting domain-containing protein [Calditrichota bacterium]